MVFHSLCAASQVNGMLLRVALAKDPYLAALVTGHDTPIVPRPTIKVREGHTAQKVVQGMEVLQKCLVPSWRLLLGRYCFQINHGMPAFAILP